MRYSDTEHDRKGRVILLKRFLRIVLFFVMRLLGTIVGRGRRPASPRPRILLVRSGHLGDMVLLTPVLHALKTAAPDASISLLVAPGVRDVVARHPDVDHVLTCPLPSRRDLSPRAFRSWYVLWSVARQLRRERYDLAINLRPRFWWGAALLCLAGIPRRVGYATSRSTLLLTHALPHRCEHVAVAQLRLVSAALRILGYAPLEEPYTPERYPLCVQPTAQEHRWASERLDREGIEPDAPVVVVHPGSGAALKLWRAEGWAHCITSLARSWLDAPSVRFVLTGSPSERSLLEAVARATSIPTVLVTDASMGQLAALLHRAQFVLGVDSGPLHLAVAQGTPTLQIFGPTDPGRFGPWGSESRHAVVASNYCCTACRAIPCGNLYVPTHELANRPCVRLVSERQVLAVISQKFSHLIERSVSRSA
jgi:ADP-heptose:LPS heptosyltransferase